MKRDAFNWRGRRRRLVRWARRSNLLFGLLILVVATVLIVGLPVILPVVAVLDARHRRRRRTTANTFVCVECGKVLGQAALDLADTEWTEYVATLHREHPGYQFRLVREVDAVCTRCGMQYHYDEKAAAFTGLNKLHQPGDEPPARPFFSETEIARLIQGQPVREPLPFDPADDDSIQRFYAGLVQRIEREQGLRARVEWNHYGSGYASFVEAWFYAADGGARLDPFQSGDERHVGLIVLLSRLSPFFVLGQDEKSWSVDDGSSSGTLPDFSTVDDITHPVILPHVAPVEALLTAAGLQRLSWRQLAALLPETCSVPTILTNEPFRQFDALFHWED